MFYFLYYLRGCSPFARPLPWLLHVLRLLSQNLALKFAFYSRLIIMPAPFPLSRITLVHFPSGYKFMANPCTMKKAFRRFTTILRNLFWFITKVFFSGVIVDSFFFISLPRCQTAHAQLGNYLHYLLLTFNTIFVAQPEMPQNFRCTPCEKFSHKNLTYWINCVQNSTTYRAQKPLNVGYKNISSGSGKGGGWTTQPLKADPKSEPKPRPHTTCQAIPQKVV